MPPLLTALIVFGALGAIWFFFLRRQAELFCVRVRAGQAKLARGRIPPRLLTDIEDVMRRAGGDGEIRVVLDSNVPRVVTQGLSDGTTQQLRNVVGTWQVSQLRHGRGR